MKELNFQDELNKHILKITKSWKGKYLKYKWRNWYNEPNFDKCGYVKVIDIIINPRSNEPTLIHRDIDNDNGKETRKSRLKMKNFVGGNWVILNKSEFKQDFILNKL